MQQLTTTHQLNTIPPTISHVFAHEGRLIVKCHHDMFFFVGVTNRVYEIGDEEVNVLDTPIQDVYTPNTAFRLGLITPEERDAWKQRNNAQKSLDDDRKRIHEYRRYLALKKKYEHVDNEPMPKISEELSEKARSYLQTFYQDHPEYRIVTTLERADNEATKNDGDDVVRFYGESGGAVGCVGDDVA